MSTEDSIEREPLPDGPTTSLVSDSCPAYKIDN